MKILLWKHRMRNVQSKLGTLKQVHRLVCLKNWKVYVEQVSNNKHFSIKQFVTENWKNILDQMKASFEIIEARLMHEINQLKAMINILLPNKPANYQYNPYTYSSPYNQPMIHQSIYPVNANSYEQTTRQTTYGSQSYNHPDSLQQTDIPQIQHPTSTSHPFNIRTTPKPVIEYPTTAPITTTDSIYKNTSQIPEVKASTVGSVTEKILQFKPVQTKSLNRFRSKHHK